ncbi:SH3 domain-containing protein [Streptomyces buecherae]|uniref:SH3 domain-containing protein n=1 Tax=Streptomyces buecherae TaxID=2763006 RepID=A0A7H8N7V1_9ACTN|nr:SH3 domain-containing protein [Streptomyces buecherae]QKW50567.1 SH3 domain-containing protein [Streptomyces buecherae]
MAARTRRARVTAATLALGVAAGGAALALGTASAQAADTTRAAAPAKPHVTVDTRGTKPLNVRMYPSEDATDAGNLKNGTVVGVDCKVRAQKVQDSTYWYKIRGKEQWITAEFTKNPSGTAPLCKDFFPAKQATQQGKAVG